MLAMTGAKNGIGDWGGIFVAVPQKRKFYIIAHNPNTVDDAK